MKKLCWLVPEREKPTSTHDTFASAFENVAELPPIPPSFDEPADGVAPALPPEPEAMP